MDRPARARLVGAVVLIATILMVLCAALAEVSVTPRIVQLEGFEVVGIAARTNNANEAGPNGVIGKEWQGFMQEGLLHRIPNRADQNILAVYADYSSDARGDYTFVLGAKVRPAVDAPVPKGMVIKSIPAGRYAVFTSNRGPVAKVVVETWKEIWAYYQSPANGQRAYRADFEIYDQRAADPNNAQVDIYIGVK
jgi:predicted transcriptional regulator YdeE